VLACLLQTEGAVSDKEIAFLINSWLIFSPVKLRILFRENANLSKGAAIF